MNRNTEKKMKSLISGLIVNDDGKIKQLVNELSEAIISDKEGYIMESISDSFKGSDNEI